ncbi:hypothetical protein E1162_18600 [Rhodobacteraceae bacterium RKSG542]|uniref:hypothetical protein n=1 Tax=Pseudovibrio flavus TaxID=2529854 RepID=UPI0012BBC916|nr:hypothetical protein [Pseudovibrio flavus]MTI19256.1 hypothetical protein [Pseudovibrio flavus]
MPLLRNIAAAFAIGSLCLAIGTAPHALAQNNSFSEGLLYRPDKVYRGWRQEVGALGHYSGMKCPDRVGLMERAAVLPVIEGVGIGCAYTSRQDFEAIFRQHEHGSAGTVLKTFQSTFERAGFAALIDQRFPSAALFRTDKGQTKQTHEYLWTFEGTNQDYSLWVAVSGNQKEAQLQSILAAFYEEAQKQDTP